MLYFSMLSIFKIWKEKRYIFFIYFYLSFNYSLKFCYIYFVSHIFITNIQSSEKSGWKKRTGWKKRFIIKKIFQLLPLSILFCTCTFFHKIVHIISMVMINKQLNSTNKNYCREKKHCVSINYLNPITQY